MQAEKNREIEHSSYLCGRFLFNIIKNEEI